MRDKNYLFIDQSFKVGINRKRKSFHTAKNERITNHHGYKS